MRRKLAMFAVLVAFNMAVGMASVAEAEVADDFDTAHDYLANGTAGTIWDGMLLNGGYDSTQNAVATYGDASITNSGTLTLGSTNGNWENANDDGFLLYLNVSGDFIAEVEVIAANQVSWHDMGLMARLADEADGGAGEDYVTLRHFASSQQDASRSVDNGATSNPTVRDGYVEQSMLQLERRDDDFYFRVKRFDGTDYASEWTNIGSSITRSDMDGLPVQVGIWQATFSANEGVAQFDSFRLIETPEPTTMASLFSALGVVLAGSWFRRRRQHTG